MNLFQLLVLEALNILMDPHLSVLSSNYDKQVARKQEWRRRYQQALLPGGD